MKNQTNFAILRIFYTQWYKLQSFEFYWNIKRIVNKYFENKKRYQNIKEVRLKARRHRFQVNKEIYLQLVDNHKAILHEVKAIIWR